MERSRPSTVMSTSAPASGPRSDRSSPKNSTCPLRGSSSCWAIPRVVPNQGATIASETIQVTAVPLRKAAAQARQFLIARAAERLELSEQDLVVEDGLIRGRDNRSVSYGELIAGEVIRLELAESVAGQGRRFLQHCRAVGAAHRSSGEGDRRTGLCSRRARARHAAWPRGAPALCRRRCRRLCRHQPDRGRRSLGRAIFRGWSPSSGSAISSASSPSARKTRSRPQRNSRSPGSRRRRCPI